MPCRDWRAVGGWGAARAWGRRRGQPGGEASAPTLELPMWRFEPPSSRPQPRAQTRAQPPSLEFAERVSVARRTFGGIQIGGTPHRKRLRKPDVVCRTVRRGASASPAGLVGVRASCLRGEVAGRDLEARAARRAASDRGEGERGRRPLFWDALCWRALPSTAGAAVVAGASAGAWARDRQPHRVIECARARCEAR